MNDRLDDQSVGLEQDRDETAEHEYAAESRSDETGSSTLGRDSSNTSINGGAISSEFPSGFGRRSTASSRRTGIAPTSCGKTTVTRRRVTSSSDTTSSGC